MRQRELDLQTFKQLWERFPAKDLDHILLAYESGLDISINEDGEPTFNGNDMEWAVFEEKLDRIESELQRIFSDIGLDKRGGDAILFTDPEHNNKMLEEEHNSPCL